MQAHKPVICGYCGQPAELCTGLDVYPHLRRLWARRFYRCVPCGALVGCHPPADAEGGGQGDGTVPLGSLANAELRAARQEAHAAFDPIWKSGRMRRRQAYEWLAARLGLPVERCHVGEFDVATCKRVVDAVTRFHEKEARRADKRKTGQPIRSPA